MKKIAITILFLFSIVSIYAQDCDAWFYSVPDTLDGQVVNFFDGSSPHNEIIAWDWDFGDGFNSSLKNPNHVYTSDGQYTVTLVITTSQCTDTITEIIEVISNPTHCFADFTFFPDDINELEINFVGFYQADDTTGLSWNWDFGDGNNSTEKNPVHIFASDSAYTVSLAVGNGTCTDSTSKNVAIGNYFYGDSCTAMFSYSVLDPAGFTFEFYDKSWAGEDTNYTVLWQFGDGYSSTELSPIHTYQTEEKFVVSLTIQSQSCTDNFSMNIYSGEDTWYPENCQAMFYFEQNESNYYQIQFLDASSYSGNNNYWFWDFGDGSYSYLQNPTHVFSQEGEYNVTLQISSDSCTNSFSTELIIDIDSIYVQDIEALFYPEFIDEKTVKFHNLSQGDIEELQWDFGDGAHSLAPNPTHDFDEVGIHEIALSIRNDHGANTLLMQIEYSASSKKYSSELIKYSKNYPGGTFSAVEEISDYNLIIYPNPISDFLIIKNVQESYNIIQIFNSLGQCIMYEQFDSKSNTLDVSNLSKGVYLVKIFSKNSVKKATFIKE